ncbi:hypothetical protein B5D77_12175 [Microcystis sp. MC19]|nr:hypothetical protein B5D77_12175 [Microcystis sp. MC19]
MLGCGAFTGKCVSIFSTSVHLLCPKFPPVGRNQLSVISYQLSVISYQLSVLDTASLLGI